MRRANKTTELPERTQHVYYFNNGYGACVIHTPDSCGSSKDLWELDVLKKTAGVLWSLCYDIPLTNNVIGGLSEKDVDILLAEIESWPKEGEK